MSLARSKYLTPCTVFVPVKRTTPPARKQPTVDLDPGYPEFSLLRPPRSHCVFCTPVQGVSTSIDFSSLRSQIAHKFTITVLKHHDHPK